MKKETLNEVIAYLQELNERFIAINDYWDEGDTISDDYLNCREGLDCLIEDNKLHNAIEMLKEIKAVKYNE